MSTEGGIRDPRFDRNFDSGRLGTVGKYPIPAASKLRAVTMRPRRALLSRKDKIPARMRCPNLSPKGSRPAALNTHAETPMSAHMEITHSMRR